MKKYFSMAVAAIAVLSSCSNEENLLEQEAPAVNTTYPTFTATIEGVGTRTALGAGNKVNWVSGDEVLLALEGSNGIFYSLYNATPVEGDASSATLSYESVVEGVGSETAELIDALYPASLYSLESRCLFFPAIQTYKGNDISFAPMYGHADSESPSRLNFQNTAALLKITVPGSEMTELTSITVSSDCAMNGEAIIDVEKIDSYGAYLFIAKVEATSENSKITLDIPSGATIPEDGSKTFYIAIPPLFEGIDDDACGESYGYLQIDVTDGTTTKSMRTTKADGIQIQRNKIYPITFKADTKGTAKATIGGSEVDVKWVQLWAGGPKFAEKNVGATSATEIGTPMTFAEATKTGDDYVWGANWCTPSKDDLDELVKAATSAGSEKVACTYTVEGGVYGFKFIGKEAGYTENSVFFPAQGGAGDYGDAHYWSGTAASLGANNMWLIYSNDWFSGWDIDVVNLERLVRPVLKN